MKRIEVVAAIIISNSKILSTQRGYGEFKDGWEFPGGKIESGETREGALIREIKEELDVNISIRKFLTTIDYDYTNFHLTMHCFICDIVSGKMELFEHTAAKWLSKEELDSVDWLPADLDVVEKLKEVLMSH